MADISRHTIQCPRCRGDLSIIEHQGQATCSHCKALVLFADASGHDQDCLALPAEFGAFIADSVVACRGSEVILHGWHRSGNPEIVVKLWPQSGAKPPKQNRHPNVVRSLKGGTEAGFDFQTYEWAEDSALNSAADLLTPDDHLSPVESVSQKTIQANETVATASLQSEPLPSPTETESTDLPPSGVPWRSPFNRRIHSGLLRGLGIKGLGCSMPMARFLADGVCVSLYAFCLTLIAAQFVGESIVDAVWATPWLSWQWFWLRHYRRLLSWKVLTAELIAAVFFISMNLINDAGFWRGVFAVVVFDTCLTAIVAGRTLHRRFGQRRSQATSPTPQEPKATPKPADTAIPRTWSEWLAFGAASIVVAYVTEVITDGTKTYRPFRGFVTIKTIKTESEQADFARLRATLQVRKLTDAIANSTDPSEQANLYQQRAQAYRTLGKNDLAASDESRAQQLQSKILRLAPRPLKPLNRLGSNSATQ